MTQYKGSLVMDNLKTLIDDGGVYIGACDIGYALWWNGKQEWHTFLDEVINQTHEKLMNLHLDAEGMGED